MQGSPELATITSLLRSRSTEDLTRQQAATGAILGREASMYDDLEAAELLLQVREEQVEEAKREVARERAAAAEHLETIQRLTAKAVEARDQVRGLAVKRADARREAFAAKMADQKALAALKRQEARIKQRIAAAAARARGSSVTAQASGYLLRPVPGPVTSGFGYREHPIYHYWGMHDGTDFGVACGEPLRAAGTGTVIAKYFSEVYGNRLYLSLGRVNGKSLTVVYNHAYGYRYDVGDRVERGAVVGTVGSTGWSTGCHLHFTVLVAGRAVDPMNWL
jgi:murein DD-endopeptidase MepM/ murein hydrolase activator NlpD